MAYLPAEGVVPATTVQLPDGARDVARLAAVLDIPAYRRTDRGRRYLASAGGVRAVLPTTDRGITKACRCGS